MKVGTKSFLFGAHCFFLHPWFVAWAWWKLYGFPFDPRLWVAFFVHDIGYFGKPNMDGPEGEEHPWIGANIMHFLFDPRDRFRIDANEWRDFTLCHSRYLAKRIGRPFSRLCVADKLAIALTPRWLYLPMVNWTGEIHEYLKMAHHADMTSGRFKAGDYRDRQVEWHIELCRYMREWVAACKDGATDTWTSADRHARTDSGVEATVKSRRKQNREWREKRAAEDLERERRRINPIPKEIAQQRRNIESHIAYHRKSLADALAKLEAINGPDRIMAGFASEIRQ